MVFNASFLCKYGSQGYARIEFLEVPVGIRLLDETVECIEIQTQVEIVDKRLLAVSDVDKSGIQGREKLFHSAEENVTDRETVTLAGFLVEFNQSVIVHQGNPHFGGRYVHHKILYRFLDFHQDLIWLDCRNVAIPKTKGLPDLPSGPLRLFLLVSVEAETLLTLVRSHLVPLMLFSVWHNKIVLVYLSSLENAFDGLKAGMLCAGMVIVVFWVMLRAAFSALCLMMKLPKPRRYTGSPLITEFLMLSIEASSTACTVTFSTPVARATSLMMSALVIVFIFKLYRNSFFRMPNAMIRKSFSKFGRAKIDKNLNL